MNFLALCQRLRSEAGISGTGPTTVVDQTGEMGRVVDWIATAYEFIQSYHATWRFLRTDFSFSTVESTQGYTPAAASITDFATWIEEEISIYSSASDETFLEYYLWNNFKTLFLHGTNRTAEDRPNSFSVKPSNNAITLFKIPDAVYTISGEYFKTADVLSGNADTPNFPARFHMAIVWKALMLYGAHVAADEKYAHGQVEYKQLMRNLELDQLDELTYGDPLA